MIGLILCKALGDVFDQPEQERTNGECFDQENKGLENIYQDAHGCTTFYV